MLATQNPIEQEGTYPLPEAQLDRFLFNVRVDYPTEAEERAILAQTTGSRTAKVPRVLGAREIVLLQRRWVRDVHLSEDLLDWITRTRPREPAGRGHAGRHPQLRPLGRGAARGPVAGAGREGAGAAAGAAGRDPRRHSSRSPRRCCAIA